MTDDTDFQELLTWLDQLHDVDMRACQTRTGGKLDDYFFGCSDTFRKVRGKVSELIVARRNPTPTPAAPQPNPAAAVLETLAGVFDEMAKAEHVQVSFTNDEMMLYLHQTLENRFKETTKAVRAAAQRIADQDTAP